MKRIFFLTVLILAVWPLAAQDRPTETSIVESHNNFAVDFYRQLSPEAENLIFSPISMYIVLAQAYGGAKSSTADQLAELLRVSVPDEDYHRSLAALISEIRKLNDDESLEFSIAGALWPQKDYPLLPEFLKLMDDYDAEVYPVDYVRRREQARRMINDWAEARTNGLIDSFLPSPGPFTAETRFNITNAIYFKGLWTSRFNRNDTRANPFTTSSGGTANVDMMTQLNEFKYLDEEFYQVLSLPYIGDSASMVILLPNEIDGLPELEDSLAEISITDIMDKLLDKYYPSIVDVRLPRFTMRNQLYPTDILKELGVTDAFIPGRADFSGINGISRDLYVESFLQDAFIEVDEEGTKAAAVTMGGGCFPSGTLVMTKTGAVPIEDIQEGTGVRSFDMKNLRWVDAPVSGVEKRVYKGDIITIRAGGEVIQTTGNHPFLVISGDSLPDRLRPADLPESEPTLTEVGRWVEARDMEIGDVLFGKDGDFVRVGKKEIREDSLDVYNLNVEAYHNYSVGNLGILVHNKGGAEDPVIVFHADHPFLYMIVDQDSRCILFMGRVAAP